MVCDSYMPSGNNKELMIWLSCSISSLFVYITWRWNWRISSSFICAISTPKKKKNQKPGLAWAGRLAAKPTKKQGEQNQSFEYCQLGNLINRNPCPAEVHWPNQDLSWRNRTAPISYPWLLGLQIPVYFLVFVKKTKNPFLWRAVLELGTCDTRIKVICSRHVHLQQTKEMF